MIETFKNLSTRKKIILCSSVLLVFICLLVVFSKKDIENVIESSKKTRLTEMYYSDMKGRTNGLRGSDVIFRDVEGNVLEENIGSYDVEHITDDRITTKETMDKKSSKLATELSELINESKFENLTSMFNKDYLRIFNKNKEDISYEYSFKGGTSIEVLKTEKDDKNVNLIVTLRFTEKATGYTRTVDFTIYEDGTIADRGIYNSLKANKENTINDITYKIDDMLDTKYSRIYSITIDNRSEYVLDVVDMIPMKNTTYLYGEVISYDKKVQVYPGTPFKMLYEVSNDIGMNKLRFKYQKLDGTIEEVDIIGEV